MSFDPSDPRAVAIGIAWLLLLPGLGLTLFRMIRGPDTADRVVALDLVGYLVVAISALHALDERAEYPLHPAMALALLAFVGTIVFVVFARRRGRGGR
jgi:multicomponent Na+:H+ antiporter subunit F